VDPSPPVADLHGPPPLNIGQRTFIKRSILSRLAPLTGRRASGVVTVTATSGTRVLPANTYGIPVVQSTTGSGAGQLDYSRMVKVFADVEIDFLTGPADATVFAQVGGTFYNAGGALQGLDIGAGSQWSPPVEGIEAVSTISTGFSGGSDSVALLVNGTPTTFAAPCRRLVLFDRLGLGNLALKGGPNLPAELLRAKLGDFPAGVLALMGTKRSESGGRGHPIHEFSWRLHIITSRVDQTDERYADGDVILDLAGGLLERAMETGDGEAFSAEPLELGPSRLMVADDGSFVHTLDFTTTATLDKIERIAPPAWTETRTKLVTPPDAEYPDPDDAKTLLDVSENQ